LGGASYHDDDAIEEGPAESAYLGIMDAAVLREIGGYDATLRRGEDWELNYRLRAPRPRVVRPPAPRAALSARGLGRTRAAVLGDGGVARRARAPPRRAQLTALLRPAALRARPRAVHRARPVPRDGARARMAGLGALARVSRADSLPAAAGRRGAAFA